MRRLSVAWCIQPNRLPTVVHDPGIWWDELSKDPSIELRTLDLNYASWLRRLGGDPFAHVSSREELVEASVILDRSIADENERNSSVHVSVDLGPVVTNLDYTHAKVLEGNAFNASALENDVESLLGVYDAIDVALFNVTSPYDLLTALITADALKRANPETYVLLCDHGYENFSLSHAMPRLEADGAFLSTFDAIVVEKDEKNDLVLSAIERVRNGERPKGYLRHSGELKYSFPSGGPRFLPDASAFGPRRIYWTRVSPRKCYWDRCTFCVQNVKFASSQKPSLSEISAAVSRIAQLKAAGADTFIFSDEALSPSFLAAFSRELIHQGVDVKWSCRAKIEAPMDATLADLCASAGCFEILFGIESIVDDTLRKMDKFNAALDPSRTSTILRALNDRGIGLHINLIARFPGEPLADLVQTVNWMIELARDASDVTYLLNRFHLFPSTIVALKPSAYELATIPTDADIIEQMDYEITGPMAEMEARRVDASLETLRYQIDRALSWDTGSQSPGVNTAYKLYMGSGLGAHLKLTERKSENTVVCE